MNINYELNDNDLILLQDELYNFFESGFKFEKFIKNFLIYLGLDEIELTPAVKDGGIDCIAYRKGIGEFSDVDKVRYLVQVKCYKACNKVGVKPIRELRGVKGFNAGDKGIFITTSDYTKEAIKESNDKLRPIILINGKDLITYCIDKNIGFIFKPMFSKKLMTEFMEDMNTVSSDNVNSDASKDISDDIIEKLISYNDVRAKIITIPSSIYKTFLQDKDIIDIVINNDFSNIYHSLKINHSRKYISGVTNILKKFHILLNDGSYMPKLVKWSYDRERTLLMLYIN